jgi:hypothetical protein
MMHPANAVTEDQMGYWAGYPAHLVRFQPPTDGPANCSPVATVVTHTDDGSVVRVPWRVDDIEVDQLRRGGTLWLSQWGGLAPHALEVQPPPEDAPSMGPSRGDLGQAIGALTESEGGNSTETLDARRRLLDIYDQWVAAGRPEI